MKNNPPKIWGLFHLKHQEYFGGIKYGWIRAKSKAEKLTHKVATKIIKEWVDAKVIGPTDLKIVRVVKRKNHAISHLTT